MPSANDFDRTAKNQAIASQEIGLLTQAISNPLHLGDEVVNVIGTLKTDA